MALTPEQLTRRATGIGSSDVAAILGLDRWRTANDVRLEKLGLLEPEAAPSYGEFGTDDMRLIGQHTEDAIMRLAAKCLGRPVVPPEREYVDQSGILRANPDGQVDRAEAGYPPVECKDYGLDDGWGEPGTAEIPDAVLVQVAHQMICVGAREAYVARLGRGFRRGFFLYHIDAADEGIDQLLDALAINLPAWWHKHIVNREPIEGDRGVSTLEVLRRVRREPATFAPLADDLALLWRQMEEEYATVGAKRDEMRRRVMQAMGTAEAGRSSYGVATFRKYGDTKQLRWKAAK